MNKACPIEREKEAKVNFYEQQQKLDLFCSLGNLGGRSNQQDCVGMKLRGQRCYRLKINQGSDEKQFWLF